MKTRIEKKRVVTKKLLTLSKATLFVFEGKLDAYQFIAKHGVSCDVHSLEDAVSECWSGDLAVILITLDDLIPGTWRIKERESMVSVVGAIGERTFYRLVDGDPSYVYICGIQGECYNYTTCRSIPPMGANVKIVYLERREKNDPDGTEVFIEV